MDLENSSTVERLNVEELPPRAPRTAPTPVMTEPTPISTPEPAEPPEPRTSDVLYAAFAGLGYALSARALLLLALIGAIGLGVMAMLRGGWMPLAILGVYAVLTVLPVVYLEIHKRA
jgi:hypothetical protein